MKILLLTQYFPPEIGAAPHRAFYHARHWVQMGHQVTVVTNFPNSPFGKIFEGFKNRLFRKESVEGITVVRILTLPAGKKSNIIKRLLNSLLYVFMTGIFFFRRKPDVIVGSAPFFAGFAAFMLAKVRGVPLVYEMRDPWLQAIEKNVRQTGLFSRLMMTLENFCLHRADKVVVIGETMSRFIARHYGLKRKPVPVFNGIEKEDIENIPGDFPKTIEENTRDMFRINFVGNLGIQYDLDIIIDAVSVLKDQNVAFIFAGEGKLKKELLRRVKELRLENVFIHDAMTHKEALALVRGCDLTIVPLRENISDLYLPLKLFESIALGTPVVVCNGAEAEDIIRRSGAGAGFQHRQPEQLRDIVAQYIKNPTKLQAQGEKGRRYIIENYNRGKMAEKYVDIFREITTLNSGDQ